LRDLNIAGRAKPSDIVSHRLPLAQAPEALQKCDERLAGSLNIILDPQR
jgi:glutathione-independent formaldehyde dehydrogenase